MKILTPLILLSLILLGVFTLANWTALSTPSPLSFVAFHLDAPLGLVLLGILAGFVALFVAYILILRTAMLMDARRYAHEVQAQRKLAEQAEASRLSELRSQLEREFAHLRETTEKSHAELGARFEGMEQTLKNVIEETGSSLSAYIGEVDDKIDRSLLHTAAEK